MEFIQNYDKKAREEGARPEHFIYILNKNNKIQKTW